MTNSVVPMATPPEDQGEGGEGGVAGLGHWTCSDGHPRRHSRRARFLCDVTQRQGHGGDPRPYDGGVRAAQVTRLDGPDAVEVVDLPGPAGDGVVIEVAAAGVCFPDVLLTRGQYQVTPDLPFVPGSEVAGRVRSAPVAAGSPPATGSPPSPSSVASPRWSRPTRRWSSRCRTR